MQDILYPEIQPYATGYLNVSSVHTLWYAQYGNPEGVPLLWLHGGPGGGCSDVNARYFDPNYYRIILMDQRGAGKSTPFCELKENNTQALVEDIEKLRVHLEINQWVVYGGSWGSLLALVYSIAYPNMIMGLLLRGVYTATKAENYHLFYGIRDTFPDAWQQFYEFLPVGERHSISDSYQRRILNKDPVISLSAIHAFITCNMTCAYFSMSKDVLASILKNENEIVGLAKLFMHYHAHSFFLDADYIKNNIHLISHLPCIIVQGRYDNLCKPYIAYNVHKAMPHSVLKIIENAGHTIREANIARGMKEAALDMQKIITTFS